VRKGKQVLKPPFSHVNSKGTTYFLHSSVTNLKGGGKQTIYYFAKEAKPNALTALPAGYEIGESKSGLPVLRKIESAVAA
jgi:hypothetical protein